MRKSIMLKVGAVGTTFAMAGALAIAASGTTGAYFSQTKDGAVTGTFGAVTLSTSETTFAWTNMMPGEQKSAAVDFTNTGTGPQDFYLVFPNATALSSLNDLGSYGEAHILVDGVEKFASKNLNDRYTCGTPGANGGPEACPVPQKLLLASNVAKDASNTFTFQFNYAGKLGDANLTATPTRPASSGGVGVFNTYPAVDGQKTIEAGVTGDGLPYQIVAVQVGQQP
jgi:hypothetical protein